MSDWLKFALMWVGIVVVAWGILLLLALLLVRWAFGGEEGERKRREFHGRICLAALLFLAAAAGCSSPVKKRGQGEALVVRVMPGQGTLVGTNFYPSQCWGPVVTNTPLCGGLQGK